MKFSDTPPSGALAAHDQGGFETKSESKTEVDSMETIQQTKVVSGNGPEQKFKAGPIVATIWANNNKNKEGEEITYKTVSFERTYKDKDGQWQKTSSLRTNDLPKAILVLTKAYESMVLSEVANE